MFLVIHIWRPKRQILIRGCSQERQQFFSYQIQFSKWEILTIFKLHNTKFWWNPQLPPLMFVVILIWRPKRQVLIKGCSQERRQFGVLIGCNYSRKIICEATQKWRNENYFMATPNSAWNQMKIKHHFFYLESHN